MRLGGAWPGRARCGRARLAWHGVRFGEAGLPTIDALTGIIAAVSDRDRAKAEAQARVVEAVRAALDVGVTQGQAAQAAGVTRHTIWSWMKEGENA